MERSDVVAAIMAGNEAAMSWYAMTHNVPLPAPQYGTGISVGPTGVNATIGGSGLAILALVIIAAVIVMN